MSPGPADFLVRLAACIIPSGTPSPHPILIPPSHDAQSPPPRTRRPSVTDRDPFWPPQPIATLEQLTGAAPPPAPPEPPPAAAPKPRKRRWWHRTRETRRTPDRPCLNCGDETVGIYCPRCGQRKVDVRVSLRRMLVEVLDDQLSLNSTLPRTLGALFFRPGHLTREYVQGRIVRYIPPFRLYLVSSLLFFIILPMVPGVATMEMSDEAAARADSLRISAEVDSVLLARARAAGQDTTALATARRRQNRMSDNFQFGPDPDNVIRPLRPLALRMKEAERRLRAMPEREAIRTVRDAFIDSAPTGIFLIMPLFALILKLLYLRRKRFYVEHFVFGLHQHSFAFLLFTVTMLARSDWVSLICGTWFVIGLYLAMKRVYGQGWFRTLVKYAMLSVAYFFILVVGVISTAVLAALSV